MINLYKFYIEPESLANYEQAKTQVPDLAWGLARTLEQKQALEHLWTRDPKRAYIYARDWLRRPWPPGEQAIAQDSEIAYEYARYVIKGLWPPGERAIAQDATWAFTYAHEVLKGRFTKGEPTIARDRGWAYIYAHQVLKLPIAQAETWGADYLEQHGLEPHQPNA
jgi:hypothetical protein